MKKLLIISILLSGCKCKYENKFIVNSFESKPDGKCMYVLIRPDNDYNIMIIDSCGKYQVGDTLKIGK